MKPLTERTLVKVQLPVEVRDGKMYAHRTQRLILVYSQGRAFMWTGEDPELWAFMLAAEDGLGHVKAFLFAEPDGPDSFTIDYAAGFQTYADW